MITTTPQPKNRAEWIAGLLQEGYQVIDSNSDELPQWLREFHPDVIALREDKKLIIEFRNSPKIKTSGYLRKISEATKKYPAWHLWVVDEEKEYINELKSLSEIKETLKTSSIESQNGNNTELHFIRSWASTEAILRWIIANNNIPSHLDTTREIIYSVYSNGYMEKSDYKSLINLLDIRNRFMHGLRTVVHAEDNIKLIDSAYRLLEELEES